MDVFGRTRVYKFEDLLIDNIKVDFSLDYNKQKFYSDNIVTFDSETNQEIDNNGVMYDTPISFQIAVNDKCMLMRTYDEIISCFDFLINNLSVPIKRSKDGSNKNIKNGKLLVIYVHNLTYDATFLFDRIMEHMSDIFVVKNKINKFVYKDGIEFRDSLMLTGMGLDNSIKEFVSSEDSIHKTGGWEYTGKSRSPYTKLTDEEELYALADVVGLVEVIKSICNLHNCTVAELPVSGSSFTRRRLMQETIGVDKTNLTFANKAYRQMISELLLTPDTYQFAKECYYGGISDTNPMKADKYIENVGDYDITSEYPTAMCLERFPMSSPEYVKVASIEELDKLSDNINYGFLVELVLINLVSIKNNPLPNLLNVYKGVKWEIDHCEDYKGIVKSGSRVYRADKIKVFFNNIDYKLFRSMYTFDSAIIKSCCMFKMDYLPNEIRQMILKGYQDKTSFKNVEGKEQAYVLSKIVINSIYGLTAQDPIITEYEFDTDTGDTIRHKVDDDFVTQQIQKYNSNPRRCVYYLWGIYVAAYGHQYLYEGIKGVEMDIIACDTDSVKFEYTLGNTYDEYFNDLNNKVIEKIKRISAISNIPMSWFIPKTSEGIEKPLGIWDCDNESKYGKLIGIISKRPKCYVKKFMNEESEINYKFTTAGINGDRALTAISAYVDRGDFKTVEEAFAKNILIDEEYSGKLTHSYDKTQKPFTYVCDDGYKYTMTNKFAIHLQGCSFKFNQKETVSDILEIISTKSVTTIM